MDRTLPIILAVAVVLAAALLGLLGCSSLRLDNDASSGEPVGQEENRVGAAAEEGTGSNPLYRSGELKENETWSGEVIVEGYLEVPGGVTLTIKPGTIVRFRPVEEPRHPQETAGLSVADGKLVAQGTSAAPIRFVSAADEPQQGDWEGIVLEGTAAFEIEHIVVKHSIMGVVHEDGRVPELAHSVIELPQAAGSEKAEAPENQACEQCKDGGCTCVGGELTADQTWTGEVYVANPVVVPAGITLTIEPGTVVKFRHQRDYRAAQGKVGMHIQGGRVVAHGTPEERIWFTSAAEEPLNGDWAGIGLSNSTESVFDFVIVEFAVVGIEQFDSEVPITNSIIRWCNAEGLYAERSTPLFAHNLLYGNGYHAIALEQYCQEVHIIGNVFRDGRTAVHHEKTTAVLEGNSFQNYPSPVITAGMDSRVMMRNNLFIDGDRDGAYAKSRDSTVIVENNDFSGNRLDTPELEFDNVENHTLDYIPGDPEDEYSYVFAPEDETRRVLDRLGEGQAFGWTLTYAEGYLWRFTAGSVDFLRLDPETGDTVEYRTPDQIMNPRGLTWDGTHFWVNDFSLLKLFKLAVEGREVRVVDSFDIPEKELGGTAGLTNDGEFLYLVSRDGSKLYQLTKQGALVDELELAAPVHHSIVWTGEFFWATGGHHRGISRLTPEGEVVGAIYPPARCTWALAWDGEHLWTVQRTCEMWNDAKVFKLQILDDSF